MDGCGMNRPFSARTLLKLGAWSSKLKCSRQRFWVVYFTGVMPIARHMELANRSHRATNSAADGLARARIPDTRRLVGAGGDDALAIGAERGRIHLALVREFQLTLFGG